MRNAVFFACLFLTAVEAAASDPTRTEPLKRGLELMSQNRYREATLSFEAELAANPGSSDALMNLAWAFAHLQEYDRARKCWRTLMALDPQNPAFARGLSSLEIDSGRFEEAVAMAREALRLAPGDARGAVLLARALAGSGRGEEALRVLEPFSRSHPRDAAVLSQMAELLDMLGHFERSLSYYDRLVRRSPDNPRFARRRADVLYQLGRGEEALKVWRQWVRRDPPEPESMRALARAYPKLKGLDKDAVRWRRLPERYPRDVAALILAASVETEHEKFERALELSARALALSPNDLDAALLRARTLFGAKRSLEATNFLREFLRANPGRASRFGAADLLQQMGFYEAALEQYDELLRLDPENGRLRRLRAQALYNHGQIEAAIGQWRLLVERSSDTSAMLSLCWAHWARGELVEALTLASRLSALHPGNHSYLVLQGNLELGEGRYGAAAASSRRALRLAPNDREASLVAAKAMFYLKRKQQSIALLKRLESRHREDPAVLFALADFSEQLGDRESALELFERLVKLQPTVGYRKRRASLLYSLGGFDEAVSEWKLLASSAGVSADAIERLIEDSIFRKDFNDGHYWLGRLAEFGPYSRSSWLRLAKVSLGSGRSAKALMAASRAIELDPFPLQGHALKAAALEQGQRWSEAQRTYEFIHQRNPNNERPLLAAARMAQARGEFQEALEILSGLEKGQATPLLKIRRARILADSGRMEEAFALVRPLVRDRPPAFHALAYEGISPFSRGERIWAENFKKHAEALKRAGFRTVGVAEVEEFLSKGGRLPDKALVLSFDDGLRETFRQADPILKATGLKAVMFAPAPPEEGNPSLADAKELAAWRSTGRWEIHAQSSREPVPVDSSSHTGHGLANRAWLAEAGRLESREEFRTRLEEQYRRAREWACPGGPCAFAFPYGDYGQAAETNELEAASLNRALVQKHFALAFIQDSSGFNAAGSTSHAIKRFQVPADMGEEQLLAQLSLSEPWVMARLLEASLWVMASRPAQALEIYEGLEREGLRCAELYAEKGVAMEKAGYLYGAHKLYAEAHSLDPQTPRYQELLRQAEMQVAPSATPAFVGFSDNFRRSHAKQIVRVAAPIRAAQFSGWMGRSRYSEHGTTSIDGQEGGFQLQLPVTLKTAVQLSYTRRQFETRSEQRHNGLLRPAKTERTSDNYGVGLSMSLTPTLRLSVFDGIDDVENASAIFRGRKARKDGFTLSWAPTLAWEGSAGYDEVRFNDSNRLRELRLQGARNLVRGLSIGYSFLYADSRYGDREYFTPRGLEQHMGVLAFKRGGGPLRATLQYAGGYGVQEGRGRWLQSAKASLRWRMFERLSWVCDVLYSVTPRYLNRQLATGFTLTF